MKTKPFKIIIAGGRDFNDYIYLKNSLKRVVTKLGIKLSDIEVVSGTAEGADSLGEEWYREFKSKGVTLKQFPANWSDLETQPVIVRRSRKHGLYNAAAGVVRNQQMANYANILVAFWDGKSKGTEHMIDFAYKKHLKVFVFDY